MPTKPKKKQTIEERFFTPRERQRGKFAGRKLQQDLKSLFSGKRPKQKRGNPEMKPRTRGRRT